jgi:thymidylate kinase
MEKRGLLIAGAGLPGIGKSTLLQALAHKNQWHRLAEPEEALWPAAARDHTHAGVFTALTWFRAMRVSNLYAAERLRQQGHIALIDSYYDKLMTYYFDAPGMEWLMVRDDPYYETVKQIALIDHHQLPRADMIVLFTATFASWEQCILSRRRHLDVQRVFPDAFPFQEHLRRAVQLESEQSGCRVLCFENQFGSIEQSAERLDALLQTTLRAADLADEMKTV